jgi:hypothetical protein
MSCERKLRRGQSISQRKEEIKTAVEKLTAALAKGAVKLKVNKQNGGISFEGLTDLDRDGLTDACAFRRLLATGTSSVKALIMKAEAAAGRSIDAKALAQGLHEHGGVWHHHK